MIAVIAELARRGWSAERQQPAPLLGCEPVAQADAEPAHALHSTNPGRLFGTEQTGIGRFVRHTPDRREPQVDRGRGIVALFEVDPITKDDGAVEREPRL